MSDGRIRRVEDLEVFRRAYRVSLEMHRASLEFPRIEQFAMADQVRRASKSIVRTSPKASPSRAILRRSIGAT